MYDCMHVVFCGMPWTTVPLPAINLNPGLSKHHNIRYTIHNVGYNVRICMPACYASSLVPSSTVYLWKLSLRLPLEAFHYSTVFMQDWLWWLKVLQDQPASMRGEGDETSGDASRYHSCPTPPPKSPNFHQPRWRRQGGAQERMLTVHLLPKPPTVGRVNCVV